HFDGARWTRTETGAKPSFGPKHLWVAGRNDAWAWGYTQTGTPSELAALAAQLFGHDPEEVDLSKLEHEVLLHWDGRAWTATLPPEHGLVGMGGGFGQVFATAAGKILRRQTSAPAR